LAVTEGIADIAPMKNPVPDFRNGVFILPVNPILLDSILLNAVPWNLVLWDGVLWDGVL
jgi:hypothetical protein